VHVIDLSLKISKSLKVFPGSPQPTFVPWSTLSAQGYDSEAIFMSTHTGTHMDAPSHFVAGRPSIEKIPPSRLVSEAVVVKIRKKANQLIERDDLMRHDIGENQAVVIRTGWEGMIRARNYMTANPGLSGGAAKFLVSKKVPVVAIDGSSIDAGPDAHFTAHKILLGGNVLIVENLCNLSKLKSDRFTLVVAPLKLQGSTGSPVRALALVS
jgi:kynurenine formamidase